MNDPAIDRVRLGTQKVVVVGQGYVGLPIAMQAVNVGYDVIGLEVDSERLCDLVGGHSYVEDIADEVLAGALSTERYRPTADLADCKDFDIAIVTVPTPLEDGVPNLSFIEQSATQLAPLVNPGCMVILESTTYPGTTDELLVPILESGSNLSSRTDFFVGYSPERIDPGNANWNLLNTPKVISGVDPRSLLSVKKFYDTIVMKTVCVSGTKVAEMTKLLENTFRHVNIAMVNEMAMFAQELGVDIWEAISAASTKPFGYMTFTPGPGVGGHCLPVDPSYLSWKVKQTIGSPFRFVELANDVNDHMPDYVVRRTVEALNANSKPVRGSRILVLGLAYKANTGDARESPGPVICNRLAALGGDVYAVDPHVSPAHFPSSATLAQLSMQELDAADIVIVAADHDAFEWNLILTTSTEILDTRHRVPPRDNVNHL